MDFAGATTSFYAAPFPNDARADDAGRPDVSAFPNPNGTGLVKRVLDIIAKDVKGFGTTSTIYFSLSAPIKDADLPDVHASREPGAKVFLADVKTGKRYPIVAKQLRDGGPYGATNLLALLPYQGIPLAPNRLYAVVVLRSIHDDKGARLGRSATMKALAAGTKPEGMSDAVFDEHRSALQALAAEGIASDGIAGLTVFTTGAPADDLGTVVSAMLKAIPAPKKPFAKTDDFEDYCVYATTIDMPEYQSGTPPYSDDGGDWLFDSKGAPILQRQEEANFVVTVPKQPMPAAGYPIVVFSRTGGGGDRPLVDRGRQAMTGGPALIPGEGPALYFAHAGWAGASIDGPHGGLRNVTHGDEQFLMFNVSNPRALRDNVRQSAAELALEAHILDGVAIDIADCAGASSPDGKARFDDKMMALMGHSMGATIAPLSLAAEPRFRAGLLSGAGGSWIENVIYKKEPVEVKPIAEAILGLTGTGYSLTEHDPALAMFQWAGEAADPPVYARKIAPRNILMMQGIVDSYILPSIANATSLSIGLDLAGKPLDTENGKIAEFTPLEALLDLSGRRMIDLPASDNIGGGVTAVVTQHAEDGIENGHEVVFQTEAPKHEYRCFLESLKTGSSPRVPSPGKALDPCP